MTFVVAGDDHAQLRGAVAVGLALEHLLDVARRGAVERPRPRGRRGPAPPRTCLRPGRRACAGRVVTGMTSRWSCPAETGSRSCVGLRARGCAVRGGTPPPADGGLPFTSPNRCAAARPHMNAPGPPAFTAAMYARLRVRGQPANPVDAEVLGNERAPARPAAGSPRASHQPQQLAASRRLPAACAAIRAIVWSAVPKICTHQVHKGRRSSIRPPQAPRKPASSAKTPGD